MRKAASARALASAAPSRNLGINRVTTRVRIRIWARVRIRIWARVRARVRVRVRVSTLAVASAPAASLRRLSTAASCAASYLG